MKKTEKTNSLLSIDKQGFTAYLESKNFTKSTQKGYIRQLNLFLEWYKKDPLNCTKKDMINFLEYLKNTKKQDNKNRYAVLLGVNHFFKYLLHQQLITANPCALIKIRGINKKKLPFTYSFEEMEQIYDNFYQMYILNPDESKIKFSYRHYASLNRKRNYVMLGMLIYQGIQTFELGLIMLSDVDTNKGTITIRGTRNSNERKLPLKAAQIGALMDYIHNTRTQFFEFCEPSEALFLPLIPINKKDKIKTISNMKGSIKKFTARVRTLDKNFRNFGQLRTSAIIHWIRTEGLRKAQYYAGHKYIRATEYYLPNDIESLIEDVAKHHPF